jgi:hypothetical protein
MKSARTILSLMLFVFSWSIAALGQGGTGTLTGTVEDTSKALIPGVTITAVNANTGVTRTTLTNESGS